jgi:hypothetical protein
MAGGAGISGGIGGADGTSGAPGSSGRAGVSGGGGISGISGSSGSSGVSGLGAISAPSRGLLMVEAYPTAKARSPVKALLREKGAATFGDVRPTRAPRVGPGAVGCFYRWRVVSALPARI